MIGKSICWRGRLSWLVALGLLGPGAAAMALPGEGGMVSRDGAAISDRTTAPLERLRGPDYLQQPYARIQLRFPGLYRVTGAELAQGGIDLEQIRPEALTLRLDGEIVPISLGQKDPARFQPSDFIEFIGEYPAGDQFRFRVNNRYNVYMLTWTGDPAPAQARWSESAADASKARPYFFRESLRIEHDAQRFFIPQALGNTDHFFLGSYRPSPEPVELLRLGLPGYAKEAGLPATLEWGMQGSSAAGITSGPEYALRIFWGEYEIALHEFSGQQRENASSATVTAEQITSGGLEFRPFKIGSPDERLDDITSAFLDWVTVHYPRRLEAAGRNQLRFNGMLLNTDGTSATLPAVAALGNCPPGSRIYNLTTGQMVHVQQGVAAVTVNSPHEKFLAVTPSPPLMVDSVQARAGLAKSRLAQVPPETRHLIIYHSVMEAPAKFLARYRTATGLPSHAVDAQDLQDAMNHGFIDDGSMIKSFVRHAFDQAPGLKHLLLFSDSTNNYRDARPLVQLRQPEVMIPIHWVENRYVAWTGGFPDCNYYGALGASPTFPDLAVGRIPANSAAEGWESVRKIVEHEAKPRSPGKAIFVSSVEQNFQDLVRQAESAARDRFTSTTLLFPATAVADQEVNRMTEEISEGADLLYYLGHGGQYVWRVGPTDFERQKDLFTPKQVRQLTNRGRYPIITCSSCYTTSFDGPEALGEVLVTAPRAGAVALIGTTWKSTVYEDHSFNMRLISALMDTKTNPRLGDAFLLAKRATPPARPTDIDGHAFTLLGDPGLLVRMSPEAVK